MKKNFLNQFYKNDQSKLDKNRKDSKNRCNRNYKRPRHARRSKLRLSEHNAKLAYALSSVSSFEQRSKLHAHLVVQPLKNSIL